MHLTTSREMAKIYAMMERCNCDMATAMYKIFWIEKDNPEFIEYITDVYLYEHRGDNNEIHIEKNV